VNCRTSELVSPVFSNTYNLTAISTAFQTSSFTLLTHQRLKLSGYLVHLATRLYLSLQILEISTDTMCKQMYTKYIRCQHVAIETRLTPCGVEDCQEREMEPEEEYTWEKGLCIHCVEANRKESEKRRRRKNVMDLESLHLEDYLSSRPEKHIGLPDKNINL